MKTYQTLKIEMLLLSQDDIITTSPNQTDDVISVPGGGFDEEFNP